MTGLQPAGSAGGLLLFADAIPLRIDKRSVA